MERDKAAPTLDKHFPIPTKLRECKPKVSKGGIKGDSFIVELQWPNNEYLGYIKSQITGSKDEDLLTLRNDCRSGLFFIPDKVATKFLENKIVDWVDHQYSNGAAYTIGKIRRKRDEEEAKADAKNGLTIKEKFRHEVVMKYSGMRAPGDDVTPILYESVKIGGMHYFVSFDKNGNLRDCTDVLTDEKNGLILQPYKESAHDPYAFVDKDELLAIVQEALNEDLDSLWEKVHKWVADCVDTDDDSIIDIVTALIIFSHFADRIGMTPYLFIYGPIGSGKVR